MKLTNKRLAVLDDPMNTNDGAYCVLSSELTEAHTELEAAGFIRVSDLGAGEVCVEITEAGIRAVGKHNGTPEAEIQEAIDFLNSIG